MDKIKLDLTKCKKFIYLVLLGAISIVLFVGFVYTPKDVISVMTIDELKKNYTKNIKSSFVDVSFKSHIGGFEQDFEISSEYFNEKNGLKSINTLFVGNVSDECIIFLCRKRPFFNSYYEVEYIRHVQKNEENCREITKPGKYRIGIHMIDERAIMDFSGDLRIISYSERITDGKTF